MRQDDMPEALQPRHTPSDHIRGGDALWWGGLRQPLSLIMILLSKIGSPEKRENASPLFEKEQGAAFMVSVGMEKISSYQRNIGYTFVLKTSIGAIDTMRRNRPFCQKTANLAVFHRMHVSLL